MLRQLFCSLREWCKPGRRQKPHIIFLAATNRKTPFDPSDYPDRPGILFSGPPVIGKITLARALWEEDKIQSKIKTTALVSMALPEIKITGHGILALRRWLFAPQGLLQSAYKTTFWREQMVADEPPTEENDNGLYGIEFSPEGLMRFGDEYLQGHNVLGIIQIRGKYKNHTDCIIRGEWARIVCLFVPAHEQANEIVPALTKNYPNIPIYVLHYKQIAEVLFRILNQRGWQDDNQCAH